MQTMLISALFQFSHFVHINFHAVFNYMPTFMLLPQEHCLIQWTILVYTVAVCVTTSLFPV